MVLEWFNVTTGGGGGFTSGIIFSEKVSGLQYLRTDIGGLYRSNIDGSYTQLLDKMVSKSNWGHYGVDAVAADPVNGDKVYCAVGMYTSTWDPNNGAILRSSDRGITWASTKLPFKVGGNMSGRGMGERLAIDPNNPNVLYFGTRAGKGLWKSIDGAVNWSQVTQFPSTGTYIPPDFSNPDKQVMGLAFVTFDKTSSTPGNNTSRIFVGVADTAKSIYVTNDAGATWSLLGGQPLNTGTIPHKAKLSPQERCLYISYADVIGPDGGTKGSVWRYDITNNSWKDITPPKVWSGQSSHGYGGLAVDLSKPGTVMVAALSNWYPEGLIWRSTNSSTTWSPSFQWDGKGKASLRKVWSIKNDNAPWIASESNAELSNLPSGWWIESLEIDPSRSDHVVYGTGLTVYATNNITEWNNNRPVTLEIMATGIEETAVRALTCPYSGGGDIIVYSGMGDVGGFRHDQLERPPQEKLPLLVSSRSVDWAGLGGQVIIRTGQGNTKGSQLIISKDFGTQGWYAHKTANTNWTNGQAVITQSAKAIIWSTSNAGVQVSIDEGAWRKISELPQGAGLAADKVTDGIVWAWSTTTLYRTIDNGTTWKTVTFPSKTIQKVVLPPNKNAGDIWVSTLDGLFHSTDNGNSFFKISNPNAGRAPTAGWSFALGKTDGNEPEAAQYGFALYGFFSVGGVVDMWMSTDAVYNPGNSAWFRMSGGGGWGDYTSNVVAASPNNPGLVLVGTNGRGLFSQYESFGWAHPD